MTDLYTNCNCKNLNKLFFNYINLKNDFFFLACRSNKHTVINCPLITPYYHKSIVISKFTYSSD